MSENQTMLSEKKCLKTQKALLWVNILNEPMTALYSLLPFILIKDFGASSLQLSLFISLRPVMSFFSYFWGARLSHDKEHILKNVMGACMLAHLPFVIFSPFGKVWLIIISAGFYQLFYRAGLPGWIEILQQNLPKKTRENVFSISFMLGFIVSGTIGIFLGYLLDTVESSLKWLLCLFSLIGLSNLLLLKGIPTRSAPTSPVVQKLPHRFALKESFALMKGRKDFLLFQVAFTIGGSALMLIAPSQSLFCVKILALTHTQITVARFVFMALGVIGTTFLWKRGLLNSNLNHLTIWILLGFGIFPSFLLLAEQQLYFIFIAFFFYGIFQAGSHLVWNLSGTFFSQGTNSAPYTSVNILMLGFRGLVFPLIGGLLVTSIGPQAVFIIGILLCLIGAYVLRKIAAKDALIINN